MKEIKKIMKNCIKSLGIMEDFMDQKKLIIIYLSQKKIFLKNFQKKIFLELFVKVNKDWRSDDSKLKRLGYN